MIDAINFNNKSSFSVPRDYFKSFDNVISVDDENTVKIMNKLFKHGFTSVKDNFTIFQGIVTGCNSAFYFFESKKVAIDKGIDEELT